jgi:diamine N-acetyltransferase
VTLRAKIVTRDDVVPLIRLKVSSEQEALVAPNAATLAQAAYETGSIVLGLWDDSVPVGLMALIDMATYPWVEPGDDPESAYIWRLMIDKSHQGKGFGSAALNLAADQAKAWGHSRLTASVVDAETSAMPFYEANGFRKTGDLVDGELVIRRDF